MMLDLALVVADKNMEFTLRGILSRPPALGIRQIQVEIVRHFEHDGGVRTNGPEVLATLQGKASHGIIMLDLEGSGAKGDALSVEEELDERLRPVWGERAKAIVIDPELEAWVWGSNNAMKQVLKCEISNFRTWLTGRGFHFNPSHKPDLPKRAIEDLLSELQMPRSSSLYENITSKISLRRCTDPAFLRFKATLQGWFGQG